MRWTGGSGRSRLRLVKRIDRMAPTTLRKSLGVLWAMFAEQWWAVRLTRRRVDDRLRLTNGCFLGGEMSEPSVKDVARDLIRRAPDPGWLRTLTDELDRAVRLDPLDRLQRLWGLSGEDLGTMFGVSRQAVSKWRRSGVPSERVEALADLAAATDLLDRKVKRERIPAVVRRPADRLGGHSLLALARDGRHREVLDLVREMFDLRRVQP